MYILKKASIFDKPSNNLTPDLFDGMTLIPERRLQLLEIIQQFTNVPVYNAYILGSIVSYQYSSKSDIDIWVVVDNAIDAKHTSQIVGENGLYLPGTRHPVNIRLMAVANLSPDKSLWPISYSIFEDSWVIPPVHPSKVDLNRFYLDMPYLKMLKRSMDRQTQQMFQAINTPRLEKETRDVADIYHKLDADRQLLFNVGIDTPRKNLLNAAYKYVEHFSNLGENASILERFIRKSLDKNK